MLLFYLSVGIRCYFSHCPSSFGAQTRHFGNGYSFLSLIESRTIFPDKITKVLDTYYTHGNTIKCKTKLTKWIATREFALSNQTACKYTLSKNPLFPSSKTSANKEKLSTFSMFATLFLPVVLAKNKQKIINHMGHKKKGDLLEGSNELKLFFGLHIIVT